jgi:hypothetical protein
MERLRVASYLIAVAVLMLLATPGWSEEKSVAHWYRLEIQTGDTTYQCFGSSLLDEKDFARQLSGVDYIVLDDVAYIDAAGKTKGWQDWDPKALPRLYINPRQVIFFNPMKGDPRAAATAKPKAGK